jgi:hypothetical protein
MLVWALFLIQHSCLAGLAWCTWFIAEVNHLLPLIPQRKSQLCSSSKASGHWETGWKGRGPELGRDREKQLHVLGMESREVGQETVPQLGN